MSRLLIVLSAILVAFVALSQASIGSQKTILKAHNKLRAKHHSPPLKWDKTLATYAQNWSNKCVFQHSGGQYGENLALGYPNWGEVINGWYSEVKNYDYSKPGFSMNTGHFTAVVWKSTTKVGCGVKTCNNLGQGVKLYTCSYAPAGNIVSSGNTYFIQNVLKP
jgi:pathogenesis-related protein 1